MKHEYHLLDCGDKKKLERFGPYTLIRPAPQALWRVKNRSLWDTADAHFDREGANCWKKKDLPEFWDFNFFSFKFRLKPTDFGHLGLFPEHATHWEWMKSKLKMPSKILNLFAYSGSTTLALAKAGHSVCHVDSAKGMVKWAKENAGLNSLESAPIRFIVDDALKFLKREIRRQVTYDAIILDPPSFGRGSQGQVFKIEEVIVELLELCRSVLSKDPCFILLTTHTPGMSPCILKELLARVMETGYIESGEMTLPSEVILPIGTFARWEPNV